MNRALRHRPWLARLALAVALGACWPLPIASSQEPAEPPPARPFNARLGAGFGLGARDVSLPSITGERRLQTGIFPALDLELSAAQVLATHFVLGARLRYQTSLGLTGRETPYGGVTRETPLRAHHVEGGIEPAWRLGRSPDSVVLGLLLGYGARALRTESGLSVPDYTVHGPLVRLELLAPLGTRRVELRVAPELIAWVGASGALRAAGALDPVGFALGGEAALHVGIDALLGVELAYRGSRGIMHSALGGSFTDTEHFATLQLSLTY